MFFVIFYTINERGWLLYFKAFQIENQFGFKKNMFNRYLANLPLLLCTFIIKNFKN